MSRFLRSLATVAAASLLTLALLPAPASAAQATFETPTATATFGQEITFTQAFTTPVPLVRAEILLEFPDSLGPYVAEAGTAMSSGPHDLTYRWSMAADGHVVPNTPITARWRLVPQDRALPPMVGPSVRIVYSDTRFDWRTVEGDLVRLHWYEGPETFGRRALRIAERAVNDATSFLGVTESEPLDFFVYADQDAFYDALGPGTRENVGGEAHSDIRTMFALIAPGDVTDAWVGIVVPHELTHLVFDTAVENPYHFPPRWLNEGVAVYLSQGYTTSDRSATEEAASAARLMPLSALTGQFPTSAYRFSLAYSESVSAVDYLVREEGTDALVKLINTYAEGVTDDEAFEAATGLDVAGFEAAWLADLGTETPARLGPQPAPAGPLPPGWEQAAASPEPGGESPAPGSSPSPAPGTTPSASPGEPGEGGSLPPNGVVLVGAALAGLVVGGSIGWVRRRRSLAATGPRRGEPPAASGEADGWPGGPPPTPGRANGVASGRSSSVAGETNGGPPTSSGPEP